MVSVTKLNKIWERVPEHLRSKALENGLYPAVKLRAVTSLVQYMGFDFLAGLAPGTQRAASQRDWRLLKEFDRMSSELLKKDAQLFQNGLLPLATLWTTPPYFTPWEFLDFVRDGLKVYRRRRQKDHSELPPEAENAPDYYKRNFHFQTDGYFSKDSAARYDRQVDLLFGGTSDAMRRLWIEPLLQNPQWQEQQKTLGQDLRVLEIGCGAGSATVSLLGLFPECEYYGLDLSQAYLDFAQQRFSNDFLKTIGRKSLNSLHWIPANAEALPTSLKNMDMVLSVFMFHELPSAARKNVVAEAFKALKPGGLFVFVDAAQLGDSEVVDQVLPSFPQNYHEPFFTDYTKRSMEELLKENDFEIMTSGVGLVSKFVIAKRP